MIALKIARLVESLPAEGRRRLALDVWRTYGGNLLDLRREIERERKAAQRDILSRICPVNVPLIPPETEGQNSQVGSPPGPPSTPTSTVFKIPESVLKALEKSSFLGAAVTLRRASFWQAEIRANPGVDYAKEVLKAEAWIHANRERRPRKRLDRFLHTWLAKADREGGDA